MIGGAMGAALRYGITYCCSGIRILSMPIGTLLVNILGCLLLGVLMGVAERYDSLPRPLIQMMVVGFCGAFTTFSTFTLEISGAIQSENILQAALYIIVSIAGGLFCFLLGKSLLN